MMVAAVAALLVPLGLAYLLLHDDGDQDTATRTSERLLSLEQAVRSQRRLREDLKASVATIGARLDRLEAHLDREALPAPAGTRDTRDTRDDEAAAPAVAERSGHASREAGDVGPREFRSLMTKCLRTLKEGNASEAEQARFWQAARTTSLIADTIEDLEAHVKERPQDTAARMQLADAYVARLLTLPGGPERGIWGAKAERQWKSVIEQDPDHWEAQYTLAYNHSMYPEFLNKTDDAIRGFERALEIQQRSQPKPEHSKTYVQLARMYVRKGERAKAKEILEAGRLRHPRDEDIQKALRNLGNN